MKAILFRFVSVLMSLMIVAMLGEVALRLFAPSLGNIVNDKGRFCRFEHDLGWIPRENVTWGKKGDLVHQNQFGLRASDNVQLKKTSSRKRVLVLGDSYVWGVGASQEELFSNPEVYKTNDELINCGVSGYGTDQEYLFYLHAGQRFDVDQVVLAFTLYNDVENNLNPKQYGYLKPYFTLNGGQLMLHNDHVRHSRLDSFFRNLNQESRVWNVARQGSDEFFSKLLRKPRTSLATEVVVSEADRKGIELTLAILKRLNEAVEARHAEFYVVFIPYKPRVESHLPGNHPFAPIIAAGLTRMGVHYREPYPEFLKSAIDGVDPFNVDNNHFNAAGHVLFAKFVTDTDLARAATDYYTHE